MQGRGWAALKGKLAAFSALPRLLEKRRHVQGTRRVSAASLEQHMERGWLTRKRTEKNRITAG